MAHFYGKRQKLFFLNVTNYLKRESSSVVSWNLQNILHLILVNLLTRYPGRSHRIRTVITEVKMLKNWSMACYGLLRPADTI